MSFEIKEHEGFVPKVKGKKKAINKPSTKETVPTKKDNKK